MRTWTRSLAALSCAWVAARAAHAALVPVDLYAPGDGLTTLDTGTGLQWLDLDQTQGMSFDDFAAGVGGFAASGWRSASVGEVCGLLGAHAAPVTPCPGNIAFVEPSPQIDAFIALLGPTMIYPLELPSGGFEDAFGIVGYFLVSDAQIGVGVAWDARLTLAAFDRPDRSALFVLPDYGAPSFHHAEEGLFLVRAIPEPTSLVAAGLVALAVRSRRARR